MIKIENTETGMWETALRGMRNPKNSWGKSDSYFTDGKIKIGKNDLKLAKTLATAGTDHGKFLRFITVSCDITGPMYWWSEYDTYKVGTVANSCSKMHKLLDRPFDMNDFSFDHLPGYKCEVRQYVPEFNHKKETWKKIGETGYEASNLGRIKHEKRILNGSHHKDGYIFATIKGKQTPIHRLVATAFIPNPDKLPEVNHIDGNKMNNSVENLEWTSSSNNQIHAVRNHLQPIGLSHYTGKFTDEERNKIKEMWNTGKYSKRELARIFNVSPTCISDIISNKYMYNKKENVFENIARPLVNLLNKLRDMWMVESDQEIKKEIWYSILQMLPESYNQKRTVLLNYAVLRNMYHARKDHKLDEWHDFCAWIETLPYAKELIMSRRDDLSTE